MASHSLFTDMNIRLLISILELYLNSLIDLKYSYYTWLSVMYMEQAFNAKFLTFMNIFGFFGHTSDAQGSS